MTTLALNTPRDFELGDRNEYPMIAADKIFEGALIGVGIGTGHARPLTSVDLFGGIAEEEADNSAGAAAAINVRTRKKGAVLLPVSGAAITDFGKPVYATDDNAFSFVKTGGVFVGFVRRWVSSGYVIVEFDIDNFVDPHEGLVAESVAAAKTLDAQDTAKVFFVTADAGVITLPAVEGMKCRIVNAGPFGTVLVTVSPNVNDGIKGRDLSAVDDKDLLNTKATACRGDYVDIEYGDATGWAVTKMVGTWAKEA
ncbi:MAG: hypothetical protein KAI40_03355 [Desulfobacterales bacterium]|nr:hypothetical protein [Desulfobacterales bacterium]